MHFQRQFIYLGEELSSLKGSFCYIFKFFDSYEGSKTKFKQIKK